MLSLLDESVKNAGINLARIVVIGFLFKRDMDAQSSRIKRAARGTKLAALQIQASKKLQDELETNNSATFVTNLSSLHWGHGLEKHVVIGAMGRDKLMDVIKEAEQLRDSLTMSDLLVVPIILPSGISLTLDEGTVLPECVVLPVGRGWSELLNDETFEARKQGVDVETEGICIVLKKNGWVRQQTKGIFLRNMVVDVEACRKLGLDVKNI
jgi:hypothetical protein